MILGLVCYGIGGLPFGVWIPGWLKRGDPREMGSKSTGATNVFRLAGIFCALLVGLADIAKGFLVANLVLFYCPQNPYLPLFLGLLGHTYSPFLKFRGGKGVAVAFGYAMVFHPVHALMCLGVWLFTGWMTRYIAVASLGASLSFLSLSVGLRPCFGVALISFLFLIFSHRENIKRIYQGRENRV